MNTPVNFNIKKPCTENFDNFLPTENGGFCNSCEKEVIDFTKMDSQEIINYFQKNTTKNTCGRFYNNQLSTNAMAKQKKRKANIFSWLSLAFLAVFSFNKSLAQETKNQTNTPEENPKKYQSIINNKNITINGTVKDESGLPLPAATVLLEGTTIGTQTDFDGNFKFPKQLKKGDVLVFSYVGYNSKKVVIDHKKTNITLEVNMNYDSCILMGKVAVKKVYKSKKINK